MLTIAYVFFALQLLALASPPPVERDGEGTRIGLSRRQDIVSDELADIPLLLQFLLGILDKYRITIDAYERNTGEEAPISLGSPVDAVVNATSKRDVGTVPLTSASNTLWYGSISIGTPPVAYTVDFDTGSSDIFLPGPQCASNCKGHKSYTPTASSTSADRGQTFKLAYGDGSSVSGKQYTDTVQAAGLIATKQALGAATTYSSGLAASNFPPDGLLGMGYQSISVYNSPPFVQSLIAQGRTSQPVFAFKLGQTGSELSIGGVNSNLFTGSFTYAPVKNQAYWLVNLDSVLVGTTLALRNINAIIDSGTTLIVGDANNVKKFYSQIPGSKDARNTVGAGYYTVPCSSIPNVKLTFGGKSFAISPDTFNFGRVSSRSNDCIGAVVSSGTSQSFWIVGDAFMRNVYTSFDLGNNRVGFANLK